MSVYADVLIVLNITVDYFLLKLCCAILRENIPFIRLALASLLGGILSLYIFLPASKFAAELSIRLCMALLITITAFGFKNIKHYLRCAACLFGVTYLYGGLMFAVWLLFKPQNMLINNSVVYLNISPLILIASTAVYYLIIMLIRFILSKNAKYSEKCSILLRFKNNSANAAGIIDSGNSLSDVFGKSEIIIVSKNISDKLLKNADENMLSTRFRAVPVKSITGNALLDGYRIDSAEITYENKKKTIISPVMAVSNAPLDNEWNAIINPRSLL